MNQEEVKSLLDKSIQSIEAAESLLNNGFIDFSAGRSYYAMFYAIEALFLSKNISYSKHSAVISSFGKDYIKTGVFPSKYHQFLIDAFEMRNIGDYGAMHAVERNKAVEMIANAKELITAIDQYLSILR